MHQVDDLIQLFHNCFAQSHQTRLVRGEDEPLYLPKSGDVPYHQIIFAYGFFSSALHEIAHWLIAGPQRRELLDYGYWYEPDGRSFAQQKVFETVEVKPQALEWILADACQYRFQFSADNLNGDPGDSLVFRQNIAAQAQVYCRQGLPIRAAQLRKALVDFYGGPNELCPSRFMKL